MISNRTAVQTLYAQCTRIMRVSAHIVAERAVFRHSIIGRSLRPYGI